MIKQHAKQSTKLFTVTQ